jgi:hypothetical protein
VSTSYSNLLNVASVAEGLCVAEVPEDWMQGRTVFGGLQAALALRATRALVPPDAPLRTLQAVFAAPVPAGEVRVQAEVLRTGSSTSQVEARLTDGARTLAVFLVVFGAARDSEVALAPPQPSLDSNAPIEVPFVPGVMPSFTQFFSARWLRGGLPFTGSEVPEAVIEVDMQDDAATAGEAHVLAIADCLPPVALSLLSAPAAVATMTWMVEMIGRPDGLPLQGWRLDADLVAAGEGYASQSVMVWGPAGRPVALSRQSMVVFA